MKEATLAQYPVGRSSYGDLKGVIQYVSTQRLALQIASLCFEFDTQKAQNGDRLTINEGIRSNARQQLLWTQWQTYCKYGTPYASLAATPYTSTHRVSIGTAMDFGITDAHGNNRALTADEFAWVHTHGVRRGIVHTGASFNPAEEWHHNGGYAESVPPIVGVNQPGEPLYTEKDDEEMLSTEAQTWLTAQITKAVESHIDRKIDDTVPGLAATIESHLDKKIDAVTATILAAIKPTPTTPTTAEAAK
jgi:hypothetical protein